MQTWDQTKLNQESNQEMPAPSTEEAAKEPTRLEFERLPDEEEDFEE